MRLVVIGLGGIGGWAVEPLRKLLPNCPLILCDPDTVEPNNIARQNFYRSDLGNRKAELFADRIGAGKVVLEAARPSGAWLQEGDFVVCAPDNDVCRRAVAEDCAELQDVILLTAGNEIDGGNVHVWARAAGKNVTPTLRQRHPEIWKDRGGGPPRSCGDIADWRMLASNFGAAAALVAAAVTLLTEPPERWPHEIYFSADGRRATIMPEPLT